MCLCREKFRQLRGIFKQQTKVRENLFPAHTELYSLAVQSMFFLTFFNICEYFLINFYSTFVIVFFIE